MGYLHGNFKHPRQTNLLDSIGQKAKNIVEFGVGLKNIYDAGKVIYSGFQAAAPYLETMMLAGL